MKLVGYVHGEKVTFDVSILDAFRKNGKEKMVLFDMEAIPYSQIPTMPIMELWEDDYSFSYGDVEEVETFQTTNKIFLTASPTLNGYSVEGWKGRQ